MFKRRNSTSVGSSKARAHNNSISSTLPASNNSTISSSEYARRCKELMLLVKDLRDLGAGILFDMPQITVIGSQSAGKSSLVEAVSGINVPRDSGTCTRCPMECNMSSSAQSWSCTIALRRHIGPNEESLPASTTEPFGPTITDKGAVELWLRRAQAAILCPHLNPKDFYNKSEAEVRNVIKSDKDALQFSKNVIVIDVKDPELTDLSFVDLPGLIQNSDVKMIELIRDLVISQVEGENTLILVTIPMSDDMENQQAVLLAKTADPHGERTIGVLTKPDTIPPGAIGNRQKWKDVIQGQSDFQLKYGYYCVRLPDEDERMHKVTRAQSQKTAEEFFNTTAPWNSIPDRNRFGIPSLVSDISKLLIQLIESNIPKLKLNTETLLAECENDLAALPTPITSEPSTEVLLRITKFCEEFRAAVFGEDYKHLVQDNRSRYANFKGDIYQTRPDFRPSTGHSDHRDPRLVLSGEVGTFSGPPINLLDVQNAIKRSIGWELPQHVPFDATKDLILDFTKCWKRPSISCFDDIFASTSGFLDALTVQHFGQFKLLEKHVRSINHGELERCKLETLHTLEKILKLESTPIFTQNVEFLKSEGKKWLSLYDHVLRLPNERILWPQNLNVQVVQEYDDGWRDALVVMANVRAYFQVAFKRFVDYIPLVIEQELNQALVANLRQCLFGSVLEGEGVAKRMSELLSEDPQLAARRAFLKDKRTRLLQIKERLNRFQVPLINKLGTDLQGEII